MEHGRQMGELSRGFVVCAVIVAAWAGGFATPVQNLWDCSTHDHPPNGAKTILIRNPDEPEPKGILYPHVEWNIIQRHRSQAMLLPERCKDKIKGVLSCIVRMVIHGNIPDLCFDGGMTD